MTEIRITSGASPLETEIRIVRNDIETDEGLESAVAISLFLDARATAGDELPEGETDRRGYWGDEFIENGSIGSKLWLLDRSPLTEPNLRLAEQFAREALAWMVTERVASAVDVQVSVVDGVRWIRVGITRPNGTDLRVRYRYGINWAERVESDGVS